MAKKLIPAATYIRMSSTQQETSPDQQREALVKLADEQGCTVLREYFDPAISGVETSKRPAFMQMLRDVEERGDFRAILCWDQDRFGRFDSIRSRGVDCTAPTCGSPPHYRRAGRH